MFVRCSTCHCFYLNVTDKLMRKKTPFEAQEEGGLVFYLNKGEKGQAAGRQR